VEVVEVEVVEVEVVEVEVVEVEVVEVEVVEVEEHCNLNQKQKLSHPKFHVLAILYQLEPDHNCKQALL